MSFAWFVVTIKMLSSPTQDNKRLRNGLKNVQGPNPTPKGGHKLEQDEVPLDYTCRAGICPVRPCRLFYLTNANISNLVHGQTDGLVRRYTCT